MRTGASGAIISGGLLASALPCCASQPSTTTDSTEPEPVPGASNDSAEVAGSAAGGVSAGNGASQGVRDAGETATADSPSVGQGAAGQGAAGQGAAPACPFPCSDGCDQSCIACLMTCSDDCGRCYPPVAAPSDDAGASTGGAGSTDDAGCNGPGEGEAFDGDVLLTTAEDVEVARAYSEISGDLSIVGVTGLAVELPNLVRVDGDVRADSTEIERLSLPNLVAIGGELWLYLNQSLLEIDLRSLTTVGEQIFIDRNAAVTSAQLFALEEIAGQPATGFVFTAQLSLPSCFEDLLAERYPDISITPGNGPACGDCSFECDALHSNCASGPFRCGGPLICERATEYCYGVLPGTPDVDPTYSCIELPEECVSAASCACLGIDPLGMLLDDGGFQSCTEQDGMVSVSTAYP